MPRQTITQHLAAPPEAVWPALVDPAAIALWRTPYDMTATVHFFDAREGGAFRISLTDLAPSGGGTLVAMTFDGLPPGIDPALNEMGTRQSLEKLARMVEGANNPRTIL